MVDYARFYLDPRADASRNMTALAEAARYREMMGFKQQQAKDENELSLAKMGVDMQKQQDLKNQRGFENNLALANFDMNYSKDQREKEKMGREVMEKQLGFLSKGLDAVDDPESYQQYRSMLKQLADAKMIPPSFYEDTPEAYDPEEAKRVRKGIKAMLGEEMWTKPTTDTEGRLRQSKVGTGEEKVLSESVDRKWQPSYKSYLDADGKVHTININKDAVGKDWVPLPSDYGKPEMKESEAREKLARVDQYIQKLETSGGLDDTFFALIAKSDPEFAKSLAGKDLSSIKKSMAKYKRYLEKFVKKTDSDTDDPAGLRDVLKDIQ